MIWKQDSDIQDREYTFDYDPLSRLKEAKYKGIATEDYSTTYSYDKHGNMKTLTRMGMVNYKPELIDDLSFDYTGNQRLSVEDHIQDIIDNSSMDFKDYNKKADIPVEYTYNTNGAMTMDLNKGVQNIKYNILNLPQEVEIEHPTAKAKNIYTYTATGTKLKVVHQNDVLQKSAPAGAGSQENELHTIDYVGNIIYEDGILDKILFDNGYYQDGNYYFYVRDHLGNNRLVTDAAASVVQSNHYYPFGMSFAESTAGEKQPYKYNNKELDDRAGLNWYDYSARMKDDWGFTTMDPHSENYYSWSPYVYVGNNPMKFIDPTGMDWWSTNDQAEIERTLSALKAGENIDTGSFGDQWTYITEEEVARDLSILDGGQGLFNDVSQGFTIDGISYKDYLGFGANNNPSLGSIVEYNPSSGFDYSHLVGPSSFLLGQPLTFLKSIGALSSKPGSSIASYVLSNMSKTLPIKMGTEGSKLALVLTGARTTNFGRFAGRLFPIVGAPLTYGDALYNIVAVPNMEQIKSNIENKKPSQEGVYNPATGQYQVTGPGGLTW